MRNKEKWHVQGWNIITNRPFGYTDIVAHLGHEGDKVADIVCERSSCVERAKKNGRLIAKAPQLHRLLLAYADSELRRRISVEKLNRAATKILDYIEGEEEE